MKWLDVKTEDEASATDISHFVKLTEINNAVEIHLKSLLFFIRESFSLIKVELSGIIIHD